MTDPINLDALAEIVIFGFKGDPDVCRCCGVDRTGDWQGEHELRCPAPELLRALRRARKVVDAARRYLDSGESGELQDALAEYQEATHV